MRDFGSLGKGQQNASNTHDACYFGLVCICSVVLAVAHEKKELLDAMKQMEKRDFSVVHGFSTYVFLSIDLVYHHNRRKSRMDKKGNAFRTCSSVL